MLKQEESRLSIIKNKQSTCGNDSKKFTAVQLCYLCYRKDTIQEIYSILVQLSHGITYYGVCRRIFLLLNQNQNCQ